MTPPSGYADLPYLKSNSLLSISIVFFGPVTDVLRAALKYLADALHVVGGEENGAHPTLFLVNNNPVPLKQLDSELCLPLIATEVKLEVIEGQGNVGYGRGHNLAIQRTAHPCHLILNPDVMLEQTALVNALDFLKKHSSVGLLAPQVRDQQGKLQYLCRRYPTLFDLFLRGFAPASWRERFKQRLTHYEMCDVINDSEVTYDLPIISGCFMLFRTDLLKQLSGFDPRYFLYFEDYDLSLRASAITRVAYVPSVRIVHLGGGAARKGWWHVLLFCSSAFKFFNHFGWRLR